MSVRLFVLLLIPVIVASALVLAVVFYFVTFKTYYLPAGSMKPTLDVHDVVLVYNFAYASADPADGDIAVFPPPIQTPSDFVKRVVGVPGESIRIANGVLYRNGSRLGERYVAAKADYDFSIHDYGFYVNEIALDPREADVPPRSSWTSPTTLPRNCYFMLGDNRNDSEDSHMFGCAERSGIFSAGPLRGHTIGGWARAISIIAPREHAHNL